MTEFTDYVNQRLGVDGSAGYYSEMIDITCRDHYWDLGYYDEASCAVTFSDLLVDRMASLSYNNRLGFYQPTEELIALLTEYCEGSYS